MLLLHHSQQQKLYTAKERLLSFISPADFYKNKKKRKTEKKHIFLRLPPGGVVQKNFGPPGAAGGIWGSGFSLVGTFTNLLVGDVAVVMHLG